MKDLKYVFCGNRFNVLEEMLNLHLDITKVLAVGGSYLEKEMSRHQYNYCTVYSKQHLVAELLDAEYDVFISNGCPYILPERLLAIPLTKFINIHPSFLPDLRGADPVPGALLHGRDSGATCHVINSHIDDGPIIAQVKIPNTADLDSGLLYQLSFLAEKEAFSIAFKREFQPSKDNIPRDTDVYYSYNESDRWIDFSQSGEEIVNIIRAFSTRSKGACFRYGNDTYMVFDAIEVNNPFLLGRADQYRENEIVFNYEGKLLIKKGSQFLKLQQIQGHMEGIPNGAILR